jgi:isopenicillin-N epimerase
LELESAALRAHWALDPAITFLNHGSFGACPKAILVEQARLRAEIERDPVGFFVRRLAGLQDAARERLARFVGAPPEDLVLVANATGGVNTVLRSLSFRPGDELLTTSHEYNACRNAIDFVAGRAGARLVVAALPFPLDSPERALEVILDRVTRRTRLALIDHVTSPTACLLPVERLVPELESRGVATLIDGAHPPGMLRLDLARLGASYYTGNCHKWLCAPKGAGFLYVRPDRQPEIHPLAISHGANSPREDRSRFQLEFEWTGTYDPTAALCVPAAIEQIGRLLPGGWETVRERNHRLACEGRRILGAALGIPPACPEEMLGSMAALPLERAAGGAETYPPGEDPLEIELAERHRIIVPVIGWVDPPLRVVRISAQLYNATADYEQLAAALRSSRHLRA